MTETTRHPVDLALRAMNTTLEPSRADLEFARVKLMEAIAAKTGSRSPRRMRLSWATATVLVAATAVFLVEFASTPPAEALITEIAQVVEAQQPLVIGSKQFAYTTAETTVLMFLPTEALGGAEIQNELLAYRVPQTREVWIGNDRTVHLRTTFLRPSFFSSADEAVYYAAGLDKADRIGETESQTLTDVAGILDEVDWPTDPVELETTIRSLVGETDRPADIVVLETCLKLLRETLIPPELRTAALRVIAGLDLELVEESPDGTGTFTASYKTPQPTRLTFIVDGTGHLRSEERVLIDGDADLGVPPGTAEITAVYSVPRLVANTDIP